MRFKFSGAEMQLLSSHKETNDNRWKLVLPGKFSRYMDDTDPRKKEMLRNLNSIIEIGYERTIISLAYDSTIRRPVIVKTINYDAEDLVNEQTVIAKRKVLEEQIDILNKLSSPLLPEPLDWITIENTNDGVPESLAKSEPLLVLDYIPGYVLSSYIKDRKFVYRSDGKWNIDKVVRFMQKIVMFLKMLDENNYGYVGLNAEHIILLNDEIPRFVGLGRICEMKDGFLDNNHINFDRTVRGYSAPELNCYPDNMTAKITGRQVGAFSLGVILHQIFIGTSYIESNTVKNGSFNYPNGITEEVILSVGNNKKQGQILHDLIRRLCEHDVNNRLCDYDEILEILKSLQKRTVYNKRENVHGKIKHYNTIYGNGYLIADDNKDYRFTKKSLEKLSEEDILLIRRDQNVIFEINERINPDKTIDTFINNVRISDNENSVNYYAKTPNTSNSNINSHTEDDIRNKFSKLFVNSKFN